MPPLLLRHIANGLFLFGRFEVRALTQSHYALSRLFVENVVFTLLRSLDSAVCGYAKTLFRSAVTFHFGHVYYPPKKLFAVDGDQVHDYGPAVDGGLAIHRRYVLDRLVKGIHYIYAELRTRHLPAAHTDRYLYLVAVRQKFVSLLRLCVEIARVYRHGQSDLFELGAFLVLLRVLGFFGSVEAVFAVVHYLAYGRLRVGRDHYEIEPFFVSHVLGLTRFHYPEHRARFVLDAHIEIVVDTVVSNKLLKNSD
jgi:hypothetical protein